MADEQHRLVLTVAQQVTFLRVGQWRAGNLLGQGIGLENDVAVGLRVFFPELGPEKCSGQAIATGQGQAARQAHVGTPQQAIAYDRGKAVGHRRRLDKTLVDTTVRTLLAQRLDQVGVPTGVNQAETPGIEEQRQLIEPTEEIVPVTRMLGELGECCVNQVGMTWGVFAHIGLATARQGRRAPAQRAEFVVAHDATGLTGLDHVMNKVQRLADPWPTVNDVAQKQCLTLRMPPDTSQASVAKGFQQVFKGLGAPMYITDQIVTARGIEHQSPPPPKRLPQPSLVLHTS